ncbi:hypothetical protein MXD61_25090 [Frankia sp. AgPm24]|uniref:ImmA/IrrE family metallo-endopeptidase n=1 Tax=Frankia sp. AgPm24 TaxID=631128 RepID=UPI00200F0A00|nr:hypothetical protein [Frankia sp. AgPm24]MCK9925104.1 hypothetical protein [Frankia sp. AgPm24]
MSARLDLRIEWQNSPGIRAPELAATWARYELWIDNTCVTEAERKGCDFGRSAYGSLYPLAEWIATNWWLLQEHVRPSAARTETWDWSNLARHPWLRWHNMRGAGDGMAWPNLTLVPEGAVTRLAWFADEDEREFCRVAARLGLDPYSVDEETAASLLEIVPAIPDDLRSDFLDNSDSDALNLAAEWIKRASEAASSAAGESEMSLVSLRSEIAPVPGGASPDGPRRRPWNAGYVLARTVRQTLGTVPTAPFDISRWVGAKALLGPAGGLQGLAAVQDDRCGLALSNPPRLPGAVGGLDSASHYQAFRQAKALGLTLLRPERQAYLLSSVHVGDDQVAEAFATELLAPAEGIRRALDELDGHDEDAALDAVAAYFGVSALTIRHQVDNQLHS